MSAKFMRAAVRLARRALGRTAPNPPVGAVVVKDNLIVGAGFTQAPGGPHAEVTALREAGAAAQGATLYVTLEPCVHLGRTPPCTSAIIAAGIRRCIYAVGDPDPRVAGKGHRKLLEAGVEVETGLLARQALALYEGYFKQRRTGTPFGVLKLAATLDGKVATASGESRWLTGPRARAYVHRLRDENDAVLVGVRTVLVDDPQLTTRRRGGRDALRIVVDSVARTPPTARVVAQESTAGCLIATTQAAPKGRIEALRAAGAEVVVLPSEEDRVDLRALWEMLGQRGLLSVLIEGGPELAASAFRAGLVNKLLLFIAPKIIGGNEAPSVFGGKSVMRLVEAPQLDIRKVHQLGADLMVEAYPCLQD
ncbi:MAG: bifunctional diaminohydroxyphosphoribosylaminopyrimidine deaminase/5-amino-6-(5-phosphoribosylamino)uracil reductase RibD [Candidatus Zipacnadales bacterium]